MPQTGASPSPPAIDLDPANDLSFDAYRDADRERYRDGDMSNSNSPTHSPSPRPRRPSSQHFRDSVHIIPSLPSEQKRPARYEPFLFKVWFAGPLYALMIALGVGIEVALAYSVKHQGFSVPEKNVFSFVSAQFLSSFFPTLLVAPLAFLVRATDFWLRLYQPFLTLSRGDVSAQESVLRNYLVLNKVQIIMTSLRHRHWLVYTSALLTLGSLLFQPLGGSLFEIKQVYEKSPTTVTSIRAVGLAPDVAQLNAFVAAAGFAEAAAFHNLTDPPFINGGWATAVFTYPPATDTDVSVAVPTVGVQTSVNCFPHAALSLATPGSGNYTITATSDASFSTISAGCTANVTFDPTSADQQYGVVPLPGCVTASVKGDETDVGFMAVMFWYFHSSSEAGGNGNAEARAVFCKPTISIGNILATASLTNGTLLNVTESSTYAPANNVTGSPLNGRAYNGVVFAPSNDPFVQARALATSSGVPGAIFRFASQLPNGPQSTFDEPNGFRDITHDIYTQHLSISANSIYFVPAQQNIDSVLLTFVPKLWISQLSAHALAGLLALIGVLGLAVFVFGWRARRSLYLTACPGSIASTYALTARSGFGELLYPYDDGPTLARKLAALRFRLDRRTGAVLAEDYDKQYVYAGGIGEAYGKRVSMSLAGSPRASRISLVGPDGSPRGSPRASRVSLSGEEIALLPSPGVSGSRPRRVSFGDEGAGSASSSAGARGRRASVSQGANEDGTFSPPGALRAARSPGSGTPPRVETGRLDRRVSSSEAISSLPAQLHSGARARSSGASGNAGGERMSTVSLSDNASPQPLPGNGGPGGYLDVPYSWEPYTDPHEPTP